MTTISSTTSTTDNSLKTLIKRYPLIAMYIIMFVIAWSVMVPQALYSQGLLSSPLPVWLELLTGWAPGIAGREGVRKLLGRFLIWRVGFHWTAYQNGQVRSRKKS